MICTCIVQCVVCEPTATALFTSILDRILSPRALLYCVGLASHCQSLLRNETSLINQSDRIFGRNKYVWKSTFSLFILKSKFRDQMSERGYFEVKDLTVKFGRGALQRSSNPDC